MTDEETHTTERREKTIELPNKIIFKDPVTGEHGVIENPTLISLFNSDEFKEKYEEDPDREWSIREIIESMVVKPRSPSTLRRNIDSNNEIFMKFKGIRERGGQGGLISVNLIKFKPITQWILDALKAMLEDDEE